MIMSWFKRRRRRALLASPVPSSWDPHLANLPFLETLDDAERRRLVADARVIIDEKNWEGCGGQEMTEEVQVLVAVQAALLLLNVRHDYYRRTRSILVYPSTFVLPEGVERGGVRGERGTPVLGLAESGGPVVLAWDSVQQGVASG